MDEEKIRTIKDWKEPTNVKGVQSFLGVANVTLGCFTNGTIAQVVTNSLSPLSGQHLYDGSGATV